MSGPRALGAAPCWQKRRAAGQLVDRRPGGTPVHAITPQEITAILQLADQWGEIDRSHRKLAHRGSYEGRVWVSPSTLLRVLLAHGRALPVRPPRARSEARPWPDWVDHAPLQVWGYDFTAFPAADTRALAILDLVSRKWIDTMLCPEATGLQVRVLFTRALEAEGLLEAASSAPTRAISPESSTMSASSTTACACTLASATSPRPTNTTDAGRASAARAATACAARARPASPTTAPDARTATHDRRHVPAGPPAGP